MASGGLPPAMHTMPPPRGWNSGSTMDPAQSHQDETIAEGVWKRLHQNTQPGVSRELQFSEKCENVIACWAFLSDPIAQRLDTPQQGKRVKDLIRFHQLLVVDPKWVEEVHDDSKRRLMEKMTLAEAAAKKWKLMAEYSALKHCHPNAWNPPILSDILSGKSRNISSDYFLGECYAVCMKRLQVLLESRLDIPAYNLTSFLVRHVFEDYQKRRQKFSFLHHEWLAQDKTKAHTILDLHIAILYKRKEDSSQLQYLLKSLPIEAVVAAAEKCREKDRLDWIASLWSEETNAKAGYALMDFAMCAAARKKLPVDQVKSIVDVWLKLLNLEASDSTLDIEVEKFVNQDEHSLLSYIIGHRLCGKYGKEKRELSLEQITQGLCRDINKLEVAKTKDDDQSIKKIEDSLAYGLQTLALVMNDHLTFRRECILTAFSLTPTKDLYKRIVELAQESGFVLASADESRDEAQMKPKLMDFQTEIGAESFEKMCQDFEDSLQRKGFGTAPIKLRADSVLLCEKKHRNLEGLISIQGDLVTEAKNYDPVAAPLTSMTAASLGIQNPRLVDDLLMMINAPRWHLLSWVLDWPQLDEQCCALLRNPELKRPTKELKYLVIDYTQFDEWSSEEEITANTGIEKGFEHWAERESDEEDFIDEQGLDPSEVIDDFNVIPILKGEEKQMEEESSDEEYIPSEQYLKGKNFLVLTEGAKAVRSDLAEATPDCLLRHQQPSADVRQTLERVVPGLNGDLSFASKKQEFEVRVVQVVTTATSSTSTSSSSSSTSSASGPTAAVASTSTGSTSAAAPPAPPPPPRVERKVQYVYKQGGQTVLIDYPMSEEAYSKLKTANNSSQHATVVVKPTTSTTTQQAANTTPQQPKILLSTSVDTLANSLISQITTPVNVNNQSQQSSSSSSANGHNNQATEAEAKASSSSLPKFQFAFGSSASKTMEKTSTAVEVVNGGGGGSSALNTPPRQLHVISGSPAASPTNQAAGAGGVTQRCIVQTLSPAKLQYNTIMRPVVSSSPQAASAGGRQSVSVVVPVVTVEGGSAQTVIANARSVLATQQHQQTSATFDSSAAANADLIRQLNVARAQGDVCIQQWGDKQVLVHKATGRWIMRQGNRLVTVPPQALGITANNVQATVVTNAAAPLPSSNVGSSTEKMALGQTIVRSMSSSTMEQLAEFDSILESKFKSSPSPPTPSLPDVVASATTSTAIPRTSSGPTFVIIAPSTSISTTLSNTFLTTSGGRNIVAVSVGNNTSNSSPTLKRSDSLEATSSPSSMASKVNGTLKLASTSAPNSPIKTVKLQPHQQSVSANASPTVAAAAASASSSTAAAIAAAAQSFVKPPPKPQEDPDTLKRIQQILDDYNEQIRNSPDLQNRPAPRRRTNGPPSTTASSATATTPPPPHTAIAGAVSPVKKRPSLSSGSPNSSCGSESPLLIQSHQDFDNTVQFVEEAKTQQQASSAAGNNKPILRQIMVPPALAASLQATGKQLVFITGSGGKKIIAMRPLNSSPMVGSTMVKTARIVTSQPQQKVISSISVPVSSSPPLVATTLASVAVTNSTSSSPTPSILAHPSVCSPSPPSMGSSVDERPVTPILGIPMEMTPGQIMEAEISANYLDDDDVQPQEPATSTSSLRNHHLQDLQSDKLPENLFTSDHNPSSPIVLHKPPVITEETEVDTDDVTEDEAISTIVTTTRKRPVSGSFSDESPTKRKTSPVSAAASSGAASPGSGMRTRQRNLSSHMKSKSGIGITESSRSSIKK